MAGLYIVTTHIKSFLNPNCKYIPVLVYSLKSISMEKKIKQTMLDKLAKATKRANKQYLKEPNIQLPSLKLAKLPVYMNSKELSKHVISRERMLATVLLRELQETIDSGLAGKELEELQVQFSKVIFKSKETCYVTWESQGPSLDKDIHVILTSSAGFLRNLILHSHVMGNVPKFVFAIDDGVIERRTVGEIFASNYFDMGPDAINQFSAETDFADDEDINVDRSKKAKKKSNDLSDLTYDLFFINCAELRQKVLKKKSQITKSYEDDTLKNEHP